MSDIEPKPQESPTETSKGFLHRYARVGFFSATAALTSAAGATAVSQHPGLAICLGITSGVEIAAAIVSARK